MRGQRVRIGCLAGALVWGAGGTHAAAAPDSIQGIWSSGVASAESGGQPLDSGAMFNMRAIAVPGSAAVVLLWEERRADGATRAWYAVSPDGIAVAMARPTEYRIRLRYGTFDPLRDGPPAVPAPLVAQPEEALHLVQFVAPPMEEFRTAISALGGEVLHFLSEHTHVVRMPAGVAAQVRALPFVRWVGPLHPAYKVDESILALLAPGAPEGPPSRYSIETYSRTVGPLGEALAIEAMGGVVHMISSAGFRLEADLTPAQVLAVARRSEVNFIDPWGPPSTDVNIAREIGGANYIAGFGFNGEGVRAEVMDNGIRLTHVDFQGPAPLIHGAAPDIQSHGTNTYGIVFATGTANPMGKGFLPAREQGIFADYTTGFSGGDRYSHTKELVDAGLPFKAVFQSNSWGNAQVTNYTTISAEMDDILFLYDILITQSQSNICNSQLSRPQAWAKNIVSLGGLKHRDTVTRDDDVYDCSLNSCGTGGSGASIGPASDGRIKPDLTHFYDCVFTTTSTSDTAYTPNFGGTSAATPITAGHFGLFFQLWHQQAFPCHGGGQTVFLSRPHMSTSKAMMIHNAFQYDFNSSNPNWQTLTRFKQGWGMADLRRMYDLRARHFIVNENDVLLPLGSKTYAVTVATGSRELRATLVYTDPKGNPMNQAQHRVNDLNLTVYQPTSTVKYKGNWGLTGSIWSPPAGDHDKFNTVENVFIRDPNPGTWWIVISADEVVQDSHLETAAIDVDYALVVSPVTFQSPCAIGPRGVSLCEADCDRSGSVDGADIACFQALFAQADPGADCNTDGRLSVADFDCFKQRFRSGCP